MAFSEALPHGVLKCDSLSLQVKPSLAFEVKTGTGLAKPTSAPASEVTSPEEIIEFVREREDENLIDSDWNRSAPEEAQLQLSLLREKVKNGSSCQDEKVLLKTFHEM